MHPIQEPNLAQFNLQLHSILEKYVHCVPTEEE